MQQGLGEQCGGWPFCKVTQKIVGGEWLSYVHVHVGASLTGLCVYCVGHSG